MGILGEAIGRDGSREELAPPRSHGGGTPAPVPSASAAGPDARSDLRRRRDALAEQVTELHWDLGGLAYEMAIRDHFRLDVLVRRAARLQERDAELAEVERLLRSEEDGLGGSCGHCGAWSRTEWRAAVRAALPPTVAGRSTAGSAGRR
jgi:hypothetical protein